MKLFLLLTKTLWLSHTHAQTWWVGFSAVDVSLVSSQWHWCWVTVLMRTLMSPTHRLLADRLELWLHWTPRTHSNTYRDTLYTPCAWLNCGQTCRQTNINGFEVSQAKAYKSIMCSTSRLLCLVLHCATFLWKTRVKKYKRNGKKSMQVVKSLGTC